MVSGLEKRPKKSTIKLSSNVVGDLFISFSWEYLKCVIFTEIHEINIYLLWTLINGLFIWHSKTEDFVSIFNFSTSDSVNKRYVHENKYFIILYLKSMAEALDHVLKVLLMKEVMLLYDFSIASRFLSQVLSVDGFVRRLSEHCPSYDVTLIQAWVASSILVPQTPLRLRWLFSSNVLIQIF